mmetsp:Transcript_36891/g.93121  ORF Transcript_36891/g.93121 Transcript_36891/m.93121 type:complete len:280 (-) Transcript_36891:244-1083(-)
MADEAKIQQYVLLAKGARGRAIVDLITKATSEPGLFGFGELLAVPSVQEIKSGEHAAHFNLLQLFAYGTCEDYKGSAGSLPPLNPQQQLKLKQLTVVSLALKVKVISYAQLQAVLGIPTVRELEDFIITECCYTSVIKGKLDQRASCLLIHDAIGRDVRPEQLAELEAGLAAWTSTAEALLGALEQRMAFAASEAEAAARKKEAVEAAAEEMKKNLKAELDLARTGDMYLDDAYMDMEDERMDRLGGGGGHAPVHHGGPGDRAERTDRAAAGRPKRRLR